VRAQQYWQAVNVNPAFTPKRLVQTGLVVPQTMGQSIGDVLTAHNIPWKYYGGGFNADGTGDPFDGSSIHKCRVEDQLAWASAICVCRQLST
jgi:phospholipase C